MDSSTGETIIKELLYGDGVVAPDPVSFQLRHANGAVIANAPTGVYVASICPSLKFCWAFPYNNPFGIAFGWRLNHKELNLVPAPPQHDFTRSDDAKEFKKYLNSNEHIHASSYLFGYPEMSDDFTGFSKSYISILISPLVIIITQPITLIICFILNTLIIRIYRKLSPTGLFKKNVRGSPFLIAEMLRLTLMMVLFAFATASFFLITFSLPNYFLPILFTFICSLYYERKRNPLKETALREKIKKGSKGIWGAICLSLILLVTLYAGLYEDLFCGGHHHSECIGIPYFMHGIISFTFSLAYIGDMFLFVFESFTSPSPAARLVIENALFFFALLGFQFFLILRPAFRFSRKAICILYFKRLDSSQAEKKVLLFVLFLIFLPTICATAVKWQYIPFRYSPQLVTVDMRYAELKIPRHYLTSWTLFPAKDGDFLPFMGIRARGEAGFARFWVSLNDIDPQIHSNEKIEIYVSAKRTSEIASNGNKFRLSYDLDADIQRQHADIDLKITSFVESFIVEKE